MTTVLTVLLACLGQTTTVNINGTQPAAVYAPAPAAPAADYIPPQPMTYTAPPVTYSYSAPMVRSYSTRTYSYAAPMVRTYAAAPRVSVAVGLWGLHRQLRYARKAAKAEARAAYYETLSDY